MTGKPHGAGKSSIDLMDVNALMQRLIVRPDMTMLDLGCGEGNYTLAAAERLEPGAEIIAADLWQEGIERLAAKAREKGLDFIRTVHVDAAGPLPVEDESVDAALMATVFHDLVHGGSHQGALAELSRVLRPGGALAIVEFKVMDGPPGPPAHVRIGPDDLSAMISPAGFTENERLDAGEHLYLSIFVRS